MMSNDTTHSPKRKRSRAEACVAICVDQRISHGAFRVWHRLYRFVNWNRGDAAAWPGFETISQIGCRPESIRKWLNELRDNGWLKIDSHRERGTTRKDGKSDGKHNVYTLCDGHGNPLLKTVVVSTTEKRSGDYYGKANWENRSVTNSPKGGELDNKRKEREGVIESTVSYNPTASLGASALEAQAPAIGLSKKARSW